MAKALTTEGEVFRALARRFEPPAYATLRGVANATGGRKIRTVDALVMSLWPSRGLTLEGVEIKVSRSDWLREMKDPAKQEPVIKYCDRFWLAVGSADIVRDGELPRTWGLLVPGRGGKLKVATQAPDLDPVPMTRSFLASILRRAHEVSEGGDVRADIRAEEQAKVEAKMESLRAAAAPPDTQRKLDRLTHLEAQIERFERVAGLRFDRWSDNLVDQAARVVHAQRFVERRLAQVDRRLDSVIAALQGAAIELKKLHAEAASTESDGDR